MTVKVKWSVVLALLVALPSLSAENPLFTQKKADPENYNPVEAMAEAETICGTNDLQHVEFYDGVFSGIGFTQEYVETECFRWYHQRTE